MFGLGFGEILIICLFLLIFIGPKKLPELARGLGKGIREFQKASADLKDQVMNPSSEELSTESQQHQSIASNEESALAAKALADSKGEASQLKKEVDSTAQIDIESEATNAGNVVEVEKV